MAERFNYKKARGEALAVADNLVAQIRDQGRLVGFEIVNNPEDYYHVANIIEGPDRVHDVCHVMVDKYTGDWKVVNAGARFEKRGGG